MIEYKKLDAMIYLGIYFEVVPSYFDDVLMKFFGDI